jgi:DNA-binding NtrC family response regulator
LNASLAASSGEFKFKRMDWCIMDHILIVDGRYNIRNLLHKSLAPLGYEVKGAHDGEEAIELLNNGYKFTMVITDNNMPKMSANAVAKHIRGSDKSGTPIVAIIGPGDDEIDHELFNFILMKPFKLKTLLKVIRLVIKNHFMLD